VVAVLGEHDVKVRVYLRSTSVRQQIPDDERKPICRITVVYTLKPQIKSNQIYLASQNNPNNNLHASQIGVTLLLFSGVVKVTKGSFTPVSRGVAFRRATPSGTTSGVDEPLVCSFMNRLSARGRPSFDCFF